MHPIKNRARLPGVEAPGYDEREREREREREKKRTRTHLIRAALNVKSDAPSAPSYPPLYRVTLSGNGRISYFVPDARYRSVTVKASSCI